MRGVERVRGFFGSGDLWINVGETLRNRSEGPVFVCVYWSRTDDVGHEYGPDSEQFAGTVRDAGRALAAFTSSLPKKARKGTLLIVTADHGQVGTPAEGLVYLADHPELRQMLLLPPTGEARAAYLHVRRGCIDAVRDYVHECLADRFIVLESEPALASGLFGCGTTVPELRGRLGDLLLLSRGRTMLVDQGRRLYRGHHGNLSPEEMLVPLLMTRLDA